MVYQPYVDGITDTVPHGYRERPDRRADRGRQGYGRHLGGLSCPLVPRRRRGGDQPGGRVFAGEVKASTCATASSPSKMPGS